MSELRNPHDLFFRETFSRPDVALDFLEHYLPAQVLQTVDLNTLELQKDTFVDPELREHFSDLLYRVEQADGEEAYVYLLLEHKSSPDVWVALQLLRYMVRIWERAQRQKVKRLPPVIPLVVYHGRSEWQVGQGFDSLFEGPESLRPYWPSFRYELQDLTHYSDAEVQMGLLARATVLLFRHIFDPRLSDRLMDIMRLMSELADEKTALEYLKVTLRYLSTAAENVTAETMRTAIEGAFDKRGGGMMTTLAEKWLEQGLEQGLEQSILRVLVRRFNQVPAGSEARLQRLPIKKLELALDEAVLATNLADFTERLAALEQQPAPEMTNL
jgi:predicted transposase/invertase (TIGR01784 family)